MRLISTGSQTEPLPLPSCRPDLRLVEGAPTLSRSFTAFNGLEEVCFAAPLMGQLIDEHRRDDLKAGILDVPIREFAVERAICFPTGLSLKILAHPWAVFRIGNIGVQDLIEIPRRHSTPSGLSVGDHRIEAGDHLITEPVRCSGTSTDPHDVGRKLTQRGLQLRKGPIGTDLGFRLLAYQLHAHPP